MTVASVVVPAHNEEAGIARLLTALTTGPGGALEVVVVANGCTDRTVEVAKGFSAPVTVLDIPTPSKAVALRAGDAAASHWPRAYVDADVVIDRAAIGLLARTLAVDALLACAPERELLLTNSSWLVRCYYGVWERLPQVRSGLFGRGVVMVTDIGGDRLRALPQVMSDDLVMSEAFAPGEAAVVPGAVVRIVPPRTVRDLVRRRVRVVTGNAQADQHGLRSGGSKTSLRGLVAMATRDPGLAARLPVFFGITAWARVRSRRAVRRGDFQTWLRDESSRA